MSTEGMELAKVEAQAMAPTTTARAIILRESLKSDTEQRQLLAAFTRDHMQEGVDFGVIPGTQKPTLLKPGAEKLVDLYRCTAKYKILKSIEDWDKGLFYYQFRVSIVSRDTGSVLAEGYGSANSKEGRYRWRDSQPKCPKCGKTTVFRSKNDGGWFCWSKKGGCGMNFAEGDPAIASQPSGKVENDDIFTLVNTILKMAQKRALVAGSIAMARCSDLFTQDLEDLADAAYHEPKPEPAHKEPAQTKGSRAAPRAESKAVHIPVASPPPTGPETTKKAARAKRIWETARTRGMSSEAFKVFVYRELGEEKKSAAWSYEDMDRLEYGLAQSSERPAAQ